MFSRIIMVTLLALLAGGITFKVSKKKLLYGVATSCCVVVISLILLQPCGYTRSNESIIDLDSNARCRVLSCEHTDAREKYIHFNTCSTYEYYYEFVIMQDDDIYFLYYCNECYNTDSARQYYNENKNSFDAFVDNIYK